MSNRIVNLDTVTHQTVQELLPWFATDDLEGSELVLVREHLQTCSQCRADVDFQRKLQAAEPEPMAMPDIEAAWAKMQPQLDRPRPMAWRDALAAWGRRMTDSRGAWMPWALAAQFAVIAGLGVLLARPQDDIAAYHALGTPRNGAGNVLVMFRPETTEQELRRILQASGARVVDGPTSTGAYVLDVADARLPATVKDMRAQRAVTLAEPLVSGGAP